MEAMPFIVLDNCKDEIQYYQNVFGGEIHILRKQGEAVYNADLHVDSMTLKFADSQAAKPVQQGDYVRVFVRIESEEAYRRIYDKLAEDGSVNTAMYEAPFNGLLAIVTDRNGVCWVLAHYR